MNVGSILSGLGLQGGPGIGGGALGGYIAAAILLLNFLAETTGTPVLDSQKQIDDLLAQVGRTNGSYIGPGFNPEALFPATSPWLDPMSQSRQAGVIYEEGVGTATEAMAVATKGADILRQYAALSEAHELMNATPEGAAALAQIGNSIDLANGQLLSTIAAQGAQALQLATKREMREAWSGANARSASDAYWGAPGQGRVTIKPTVIAVQ